MGITCFSKLTGWPCIVNASLEQPARFCHSFGQVSATVSNGHASQYQSILASKALHTQKSAHHPGQTAIVEAQT